MLGRLEWEVGFDVDALVGAGDWVREVGVEDVFGGPFAQADLCGVEGFGALAMEDLLILRQCRISRKKSIQKVSYLKRTKTAEVTYELLRFSL